MRGKNRGWTDEQDLEVLSGKRVEGFSAQQNCDRRYVLRKRSKASAVSSGRKFLKALSVLRVTGKVPKEATSSFLEVLGRVIRALSE